MGKTLKDILDDAQTFNDDLIFKTQDGNEFKLGDMRAHRKVIDGETAAAKAKREEAEAAAKEAATILAVLKKAQDEMNANPTGGKKDEPNKGADWKADPLYAPLVPVFEALEKQAKQGFELAGALQKELTRSTAFYTIERLRNEYNSAPESFRKATPFEKAVAAALANKEMDTFGEGENAVSMPTLRRRIHEGTEQDRINAAVETRVAEEKKKWDEKQRLDSLPKPGKFRTAAKSDKPPIAKLEELTSDVVANDPDIIKASEGLLQ